MRSSSRCRTSVRQDLTSSTAAAAAALNPPKLTLSGLLCPTFSHILTTFFYLIFLQHFFSTLDQDFCIRWPRVFFWLCMKELFYRGEWRGDFKSLKLNPSACSICFLCARPDGVCIIHCNTWLNAVEILSTPPT